jgi:hypothetical protein
MICPNCSSNALEEFSTEMMIHCIGVQKLDNSGILIFTKVFACLQCGFAHFTTPENELAQLAKYYLKKPTSSDKNSQTSAA